MSKSGHWQIIGDQRLFFAGDLAVLNLVCAFAFVSVEPVKILSKKEQKKLEDEEFEKIMAEAGVSEG